MPYLKEAYDWAIYTCNAEHVGYSQDYRCEETYEGITYYDCSSFIWYALMNGGFNVVEANYDSEWPFTTSTMGDVLLNLDFEELPITTKWKAGDIVWRDGHCEMVYEGYRTMGAHTDKYALPDQVSINKNNSSPDSWEKLYRYSGEGGGGIVTRGKKMPVWMMCRLW